VQAIRDGISLDLAENWIRAPPFISDFSEWQAGSALFRKPRHRVKLPTITIVEKSQMPRSVRQFEPQITRSGGVPSKYRFTARCAECPTIDSYEASQSVGDAVIKGYFKDRGWLLGRDRTYDLCPACLARPRDTERRRATESPRHGFAVPAGQPDREAAPMKARPKDTAEILARHLGKPEALAAEVFRPKERQPPRPAAPVAAIQPVTPPALSPELEHALTGMAADLKGLRSTMELMAEQVSKLVALGGQQIEAIARLAPAVIRSAEGLSGGLQQMARAVQAIPYLPPTAIDQKSRPEAETSQELTQGGEPASAPATEVQMPTQRGPGKRQAKDKEGRATAAPVVVRSIADAKRSDRFYTAIRLPRELWDQAGFGPDDRLLLDWNGTALTIERTAEGGVKPKSIGEASVVLQSWKLGDLNFDQLRVTGANASLRLTTEKNSKNA